METKYKEVRIWVADNGYTVSFKEYVGNVDLKQGYKVACTLDEVKKILEDNLLELKD